MRIIIVTERATKANTGYRLQAHAAAAEDSLPFAMQLFHGMLCYVIPANYIWFPLKWHRHPCEPRLFSLSVSDWQRGGRALQIPDYTLWRWQRWWWWWWSTTTTTTIGTEHTEGNAIAAVEESSSSSWHRLISCRDRGTAAVTSITISRQRYIVQPASWWTWIGRWTTTLLDREFSIKLTFLSSPPHII